MATNPHHRAIISYSQLPRLTKFDPNTSHKTMKHARGILDAELSARTNAEDHTKHVIAGNKAAVHSESARQDENREDE